MTGSQFLQRLFGAASTLHECRRCGTVLDEEATECRTCGATEIATYQLP